MRAVDIVAPDDYDWDFERFEIGMHQHLCGSLAGSIWVCWSKYTCLQQVIIVILNFTIHLI